MSPLAPEARRLAALAAVFAPTRVEALAARLADDPGDDRRAAILGAAKRTRGERLAALREVVLALREATPCGASERCRPALRRLLRERAARACG